MKVVKFGGTSLANAAQIKKACDIVINDPDRRVMVVSAPGKRCKEDTKVTDLLIACATDFIQGGSGKRELDLIAQRFDEMAAELGVTSFTGKDVRENLLSLLNAQYEHKDQLLDAIKSAGEDNNAKLIAAYLNISGHPAEYINPLDAGMYLSDDFGNAMVLPESLDNLKKLGSKDCIIVFPGFFGYTKSGRRVTFSRGGSDITGSILAAALGASEYENFTDVNSVFAANPAIVKNPAAIPAFTYREMRELAYAGFTVLHEDTLEQVYRVGIPVHIRNTNNPTAPGTLILTHRESYRNIVAGVAGEDDFVSINMSKYMMNREIGFGRKLLQILEDYSLSFEHIPSGIDNLSVILRKHHFTEEVEKKVIARIKSELEVDFVEVDRQLAIVIIVGEGMRSNMGVAAKSTLALANAGVNIKMINQGSSEISIIFGVASEDRIKAVNALYDAFFPRGEQI